MAKKTIPDTKSATSNMVNSRTIRKMWSGINGSLGLTVQSYTKVLMKTVQCQSLLVNWKL